MGMEKVNHLVLECIHVQHAWTNLSILLHDYNAFVQFNLSYKLLGFIEGNKLNILSKQNFITLLGKYFIFKNKYKTQHPTLMQFKSYQILCKQINIENTLFHEIQTFPIEQEMIISEL